MTSQSRPRETPGQQEDEAGPAPWWLVVSEGPKWSRPVRAWFALGAAVAAWLVIVGIAGWMGGLVMPRKANAHERFKATLLALGGEVLAPTNPYEVMRFKTKYGTGVVYRNSRERENWNEAAVLARDHVTQQKGSLAPVKVVGRIKAAGVVQRLRERDGDRCFFCRASLGSDVSVEHLVAKAHGGPNHVSNMFLAHVACNQRAGHLSAVEKIMLRDDWTALPTPERP